MRFPNTWSGHRGRLQWHKECRTTCGLYGWMSKVHKIIDQLHPKLPEQIYRGLSREMIGRNTVPGLPKTRRDTRRYPGGCPHAKYPRVFDYQRIFKQYSTRLLVRQTDIITVTNLPGGYTAGIFLGGCSSNLLYASPIPNQPVQTRTATCHLDPHTGQLLCAQC